MTRLHALLAGFATAIVAAIIAALPQSAPSPSTTYTGWQPPLWSSDSVVTWDYPIVCCRCAGDGTVQIDFGHAKNNSLRGQAGTDLVLIKADGTETTLVAGGADAIGDPVVSFDATKVYFTRYYNCPKSQAGTAGLSTGADIFVLNVSTNAVTQITNGGYQPNRAADDGRTYPVWNAQPCEVPDPLRPGQSRIVFVSNRYGYRMPHEAVNSDGVTVTQLFVMDDDGSNVEQIGHLNIAGAISPVVLRNGTVAFSSKEDQNLRVNFLWSMWGIDPDGTSWYPFFFDANQGNPPGNAFHFLAQLGDGSMVMEDYYHSSPFGTLYRWPEPGAAPNFYGADTKNSPLLYQSNPTTSAPWKDTIQAKPFQPVGAAGIVPWSNNADSGSYYVNPSDPTSPQIGKVTHPAPAPRNDLLVAWTPGDPGHGTTKTQCQICAVPGGNATAQPNQLRALKSSPTNNYFFPRALVPYQAIYGMATPQVVPELANDGSINVNLAAGTPFGLIGTSSMYKRESFSGGQVGADPANPVTATWPGTLNPADIVSLWKGVVPNSYNWLYQGAESSLYANSDIAAVRIVVQEATTNPYAPQSLQDVTNPATVPFANSASERLRILTEIPVRKFLNGIQPTDPDGNPDTSWFAKIVGNQSFTFQMLDNNGMVLTMAQTWHQVRPGEMRVNCGGCHAHSQVPTDFALTASGQTGAAPWDTSSGTCWLLTSKANDTSGQQWDTGNVVGLKSQQGIKDVEFYRHVLPILTRSCVPCHNGNANPLPGNVRFDDLSMQAGFTYNHVPTPPVPTVYAMLANNYQGNYGGTNIVGWGKGQPFYANQSIVGSRYAYPMRARASLLAWKIFGARLDGRLNSDIPTETTPGNPATIPLFNGAALPQNQWQYLDIDFDGNQCPPPGAVVNGVAVPQLADDEKRDIARWIDLGMPIDLAYNPTTGQVTGPGGWMQDDTPPTLTLFAPTRGTSAALTQIQFGIADAYSGIDPKSLSVTADFAIDGNAAGSQLAALFAAGCGGIGSYCYAFKTPITTLPVGNLTIRIADLAGNRTVMVRKFSIGPTPVMATAKARAFAAAIAPTPTSERRKAISDLQTSFLDAKRRLDAMQLRLNRLQGIEGPAPGTVNPPPFRSPRGRNKAHGP